MDLFVRSSNRVAIGMYERMGYVVYRTVLEYYSASALYPEEEDAFGISWFLCRYLIQNTD